MSAYLGVLLYAATRISDGLIIFAVQIGDAAGIVEHIGIRASVISTTSGSEIIMPNGKFISDPVTNSTFSKRQRLNEVPVGVALGTDANRVIELLQSAAGKHPHVVSDPPPQALLTSSAVAR